MITDKDLENARLIAIIKSLKKMPKLKRFLLRKKAAEKEPKAVPALNRLLEMIEEEDDRRREKDSGVS